MVQRRTRIESLTLPRSLNPDDVKQHEAQDGTWYELRNAGGHLLYARHLPDPRPEVFRSDGTMRRLDSPTYPTIDMLLPETGADDDAVRLVSSELPGPTEKDTGGGAAVVADLPVRELTRPEE